MKPGGWGRCASCGRMAQLDRHTDECDYCHLGEWEGCPYCGVDPCRCRSKGSRQKGLTGSRTVPYGDGVSPPPTTTEEHPVNATITPATDKQVAFVNRLLAEREGLDGIAEIRAIAAAGLSKADAGQIIDALIAIPRPRATAPAAAAKTNRFAGKCVRCGVVVPAEQGVLVNDRGWKVFHAEGQCVEAAAPAETDGYEAAKGDVHLIDDALYRVYIAQGTGRPYAVALTDTGKKGSYAPGIVRRMTEATLITAEQAAEFGRLTDHCVFCGLPIDTPESTAVGYGPVCAQKRGLPWG